MLLKRIINGNANRTTFQKNDGILLISTYPPKVCGIATYSEDLINAIVNMFTFNIKPKICAINIENDDNVFYKNADYILDTSSITSYMQLAQEINKNPEINTVLLQHEFGLYDQTIHGLNAFLKSLKKNVIITLHTVIANPTYDRLSIIKTLASYSKGIIVMTNRSLKILVNDYNINPNLITVIPHGTHLTNYKDKKKLKLKYKLNNKIILSTFGLLGPGKNIETTLKALPEIILDYPNICFLVLGKTHPNLIKNEGETYRTFLENLVTELKINDNVIFINKYLALDDLINYLLLTDVYLFTSNDRNQAVSGTFAYAVSCGCPIISTPIPHALEVVTEDIGKIIDFESTKQLIIALKDLLDNKNKRDQIKITASEKMAPTSWENTAIKHMHLITKLMDKSEKLNYAVPKINLDHINNLTTTFGILQFSELSKPDKSSGYTLDDNARALIAILELYSKTKDHNLLIYIEKYLKFIKYCQRDDGKFYNYVSYTKGFTLQNEKTNLDDSNGRAIWALGHLVSMKDIIPRKFYHLAEEIIDNNIKVMEIIKSPRAMGFLIKGLYLQNNENNKYLIKLFSIRLFKQYESIKTENWHWFEDSITYGNSILCEAMLYGWLTTSETKYKKTAIATFEFLISKTFVDGQIHPINNKNWLQKNHNINYTKSYGEQPIDVCYTILSLKQFYKHLKIEKYKTLIQPVFNWFLGENHLKQIVYNPKTGGCYDGIEKNNVNLNQGSESTICYLLARLNLTD